MTQVENVKYFVTYSGNPQNIKDAFLTGRRYTSHFRSGLFIQYSHCWTVLHTEETGPTVAHTRTHNFLIPTYPQHPSADTPTEPSNDDNLETFTLTTSLDLGLYLPLWCAFQSFFFPVSSFE
jgi:hypothetical protein